jgi:hypothetical protein
MGPGEGAGDKKGRPGVSGAVAAERDRGFRPCCGRPLREEHGRIGMTSGAGRSVRGNRRSAAERRLGQHGPRGEKRRETRAEGRGAGPRRLWAGERKKKRERGDLGWAKERVWGCLLLLFSLSFSFPYSTNSNKSN